MQKIFIKSSFKGMLMGWVLLLTSSFLSKIEATTYYDYEIETITTGLSQPDGICINASGMLYVADRSSNYIKRISVSDRSVTTVASGLSGPSGICVDSANNIYFGELGGGDVRKILASDNSMSTLVSDSRYHQGVCIDASGNLFYSTSFIPGAIYKINAGSTESSLFCSDGLSQPIAICLDSLGNIYTADWGAGTIVKVSPAGVPTTIASGLSYTTKPPYGICVDLSGNVYFSEFDNTNDHTGNVKKILVSDSSIVTIASGLSGPAGLCVDSVGNIYVAELFSGTILKLTSPAPSSFVNVNFTTGAHYSGPVTGGIIFTGSNADDVCTFDGHATDDVQVTVGKISMSSATPIASERSMRLNGGDLMATANDADVTLPTVAMDQDATLYANVATAGHQIDLVALTGSGALTIATIDSSPSDASIHLGNLSGNSGGIAACSQAIFINSSTQFPTAASFFEGDATVSALPTAASW